MTQTAGEALTTEIRTMYQIGPRTRWGRKTGRMVNREYMLRDIREAIGDYRGVESERRTAIFDKAHAALSAYGKFVENYRIDGLLRCQITTARPWAFVAFLGEMVDSGCANMAEFEMWFQAQTRSLYAERVAA